MRAAAILFGLAGCVAAWFGAQTPAKPVEVVVTGDIDGYLSPCGCTTPMTGGIMRQATLIRRLRKTANVVMLYNGAFVADHGAQDDMKAVALAETLGYLNVAAVGLTASDARRGLGAIQTIQNVCDNTLVCGAAQSPDLVHIDPDIAAGPMLVGSAASHPENVAHSLGTTPIPIERAVSDLLADAEGRGLAPVLLLDGDIQDAESIAQKFPALRLIVYRSASDSPKEAERIGDTLLVTPGQFGKSVVHLSFVAGRFDSYQVVPLGPEFGDDPTAAQFMRDYLKRVDQAGFLDQIVRKASRAFAGTATCGKCHAEALKVWAGSKHALGLKSLAEQGHQRDPDCVGCHVVGLAFKGGFRSATQTPQLAAVGCESCHGAGADHSRSPHNIKLPKVGTQMCAQCHTIDRSPLFKPLTYWALIRHR